MGSSFVLPFVKKEKIAKDTYSFYFDRKKIKFDFNPGEYIRMSLQIKNPDKRGSSRYFTIASSPLDKDFLIITTKVIKSSFKKKLLVLKKGENVKFFGPMGNFIINKNDKGPFIFISGGLGITTFYSMLKFAFKQKQHPIINLIAFFSESNFAIYKEELKDMEEKDKHIKVNYIFTKTEGRMDKTLIKKYLKSLENKFFVVGPPLMVEKTCKILYEIGVKKENIQLEDFTGY